MDTKEFDKRLEEAYAESGLNKDGSEKEEDFSNLSSIAKGMRIGLEFAGGIGVGIGIGMLIDHYAGTAPIFLVIFMIFGFGAGLINIYRLVSDVGDTIGTNRDQFIKNHQMAEPSDGLRDSRKKMEKNNKETTD